MKINKIIPAFLLSISLFLSQTNAWSFSLFDTISNSLQSTVGESLSNNKQPADQKNQKQYTRKTTGSKKSGVAKKNANVRSAPSTSGKKVGKLLQGNELIIIKKQGKWLNIEADTESGFIQGWVYSPLIQIISNRSTTTSTPAKSHSKNRKNVYYAGYSKDFQPVKQMMKTGNLKGVEIFFSKREEKIRKESQDNYALINNIGLLRWMERGTLGLDTRQLDKSIKGFENAEIILNVRKEDSQVGDLLTSITSFAAETVTGNEEFQEYPGEGYEKVLMLNYKSIAYLLDGKRKAYNTTRRSIDWQNIEKNKFDAELRKNKEESKSSSSSENKDSGWQQSYKNLDRIAEKVPSAYVNPFGYYVSGMIQEFESKDDRSLRDNARISYEKGLKLNPQSKVLKQAVKDMKKKYDKNRRLVHIVVADGFVPEKKMLVYNIPTGNGMVPIKLSIYEPVDSSVAKVEVQTTSGKRLATLSAVADIEAICLRHQKDMEGFRTLRVGLAITRSVGVNQATSRMGIFGAMLGGAVNSMAAPDMRSWMSLPATLQAARINISKNISKVKIVSFDKKGRRLASKTVKINKKSDNFIYARSIEKQLYVNESKELWL
jgi:uncharacterized protein